MGPGLATCAEPQFVLQSIAPKPNRRTGGVFGLVLPEPSRASPQRHAAAR